MINTYAVMAHAMPEQLALLLDRLLPPGTGDRVVLHLDARSTLWRHQRERFASHPSGRLTLIEQPFKVLWGHYSQVDCQRPLLRAALAEPFDYFHLISGADWPACPLPQIARDIAAYGERRPIFTDLWGELQLNRMDDWWFEHPKINLTDVLRLNENIARAQVRASWALTRWGKKLGLKRSTYAGQPWMKGSSWYSVPQDVARVLLAEYDRLMHEGRLRFTQCADEHVAPSVFARKFSDRIEPARRYIDWSGNASHPKLLRAEDEAAIRESGAWFARKCDARVDDFFLNLPA